VDGGFVAQAGACGDCVGVMILDPVIAADSRGDAALRVHRVGFGDLGLGENSDPARRCQVNGRAVTLRYRCR
jgi:hypothetical protein